MFENNNNDLSLAEIDGLEVTVLPDREALWGTHITVGVSNSTLALQLDTAFSAQVVATSQHVTIINF